MPKTVNNVEINDKYFTGTNIDIEDFVHLKNAKNLVKHIARRKEAGYCPFLPRAIAINAVWYELINDYSFTNFSTVIEDKIKKFEKLPPREEGKKYKTLILVFPKIPFRPAHEILDYIQQDLKKFIIKYKKVIGGFSSNTKYQTLYLIIRNLVEADLSFLLMTSSIPDKIMYLENYLKIFSGTLSYKQQELALTELKKAKETLAN